LGKICKFENSFGLENVPFSMYLPNLKDEIPELLKTKNKFSSTNDRDFGIPEKFLNHGTRAQIMSEIGLTAQDISREIIEAVARLDNALSEKKN
jgi:hypothetical protein